MRSAGDGGGDEEEEDKGEAREPAATPSTLMATCWETPVIMIRANLHATPIFGLSTPDYARLQRYTLRKAHGKLSCNLVPLMPLITIEHGGRLERWPVFLPEGYSHVVCRPTAVGTRNFAGRGDGGQHLNLRSLKCIRRPPTAR